MGLLVGARRRWITRAEPASGHGADADADADGSGNADGLSGHRTHTPHRVGRGTVPTARPAPGKGRPMTTTSPPTSPRSRLGHAYGEQLARNASPGRPTAAALESATLRLAYQDRFLNGPAFLGESELRTLVGDLHTVYGLLRSLPERRFGGSITALASAVGLNPPQAALITRSARTGSLLPLGRADLYHDGTGFRLLEFNVTSALGGFENADINRAMLAYPPLAEFVRRHGLRYEDTLGHMVRTMYAECAANIPTDRAPVVAVVDTVENFAVVGPRLRVFAEKLADHGVEGIACDLGGITYPNGRPTASGRTVDVVFRYFLPEDLTDPTAAAQLEPLLTAVEQGRLGLFEAGWTPSCTATRAPWRCSPTSSTATGTTPPNWPAWTGSCRGRGTCAHTRRIPAVPGSTCSPTPWVTSTS